MTHPPPTTPRTRPRPFIVVHARTPSTAEFRLVHGYRLIDKLELQDGCVVGVDRRSIPAFRASTLSEAVASRARDLVRSGFDVVGSEQTAKLWLGGMEPERFRPNDLVVSDLSTDEHFKHHLGTVLQVDELPNGVEVCVVAWLTSEVEEVPGFELNVRTFEAAGHPMRARYTVSPMLSEYLRHAARAEAEAR